MPRWRRFQTWISLVPRLSMAALRRFEVAKVSEVRLDKYWMEDISGGSRADLVRAVAS